MTTLRILPRYDFNWGESYRNARDHLVQPWPTVGDVGEEVRPFVEASGGIHVFDEMGRPLIDGPAGMWCTQVGHRRTEIAEAIARQAMELSFVSPWSSSNVPAADLAGRIAAATPGDLDRIFFTTGGTTAAETALRFVQFYNNALGRPLKKRIISREHAYHGSGYLSGSCCGKPRDRGFMDEATDIVRRVSAPYPYRRPEGMSVPEFEDFLVGELEGVILEEGPDRVAAFIAEPIQASGGVIVPPPGYHRRIRALCQRYDVLYIADEVVTGFGRLGHLFASEEVFGITPDIITFAKGVTSGYVPLGGVAISNRLFDRMKARPGARRAMFANGYTYSSHPVACAAALANLDIFEREGLLAHVRALAPYFQSALKTLEDLPLVGEVRGKGLMACVECVADREHKNPLALDIEVGRRIDAHCHELGLIVRPLINMCVMSPPLIIRRQQVDEMVAILRRGIELTMDDLVRERLWRG
jgi:adenosylmethionine-8-amino-7-oxononanoate aminotransferase